MTPDRNLALVADWKSAADHACLKRREQIEVMDIYDIQTSKCKCPAFILFKSH